MPFWTMIYTQAFVPLLIISVILAWRYGGRGEKLASIAYSTATISELLSRSPSSEAWKKLEFGVAITDTLLLIALTAICVKFQKKWLLCASAIQLLVTLGHLAKALGLPNSRLVYAILTGSGGYLSLILLLIGTFSQAARQVRPQQIVKNAAKKSEW